MDRVAKLYEMAKRDIREDGPLGLARTASNIKQYSIDRANSSLIAGRGTNVYERDWDILILLDCATVEMMREVEGEYDFLTSIREHTTTGTCSSEWMKHTFKRAYRREMSETLHVTANTSSERRLDSDSFLHLEEVWKTGWDEEIGTIPARAVTDRAIRLARDLEPNRTIVHYMQPHLPFVNHQEIDANVVSEEGVDGKGMNLDELHSAGYDTERLWDLHVDNLRYVLDDVRILLSNIDGKVVISADHGQAFGENGVWGHPASTPIDVLRKVPWCVTSAADTETYEPEFDLRQRESTAELGVDEKLKALGYK